MRPADVLIPSGGLLLGGSLDPAGGGNALVLFAHGSGSSRHSPRNQSVAAALRSAGVGTLLFDLLTPDEESRDRYTGHLRFDVGFLGRRLADATRWTLEQSADRPLALGYFGASTGAAAALIAGAAFGDRIGAIVARGGRPDLAMASLPGVTAPTLLIVGALDSAVIDLNERAYERLACEKELTLVPGATHLFEEPGTLDQVSALACDWFRRHLLGGAPEQASRSLERRP